jgi:hypothetical protein
MYLDDVETCAIMQHYRPVVNLIVRGNTWNTTAVQTEVNVMVCGNTWNNTAVQTEVSMWGHVE